MGNQLVKELFGFCALGLEFLFGLGQLDLFILERDLLGGKILLSCEDVRGKVAQLVHHALVALGDFFDHGDAVEHFGEAVGAENDCPIGNVTLLLHRAQALLVAREQLGLLRLQIIQLGLLFGNEKIVLLELVVEVLHLLIQQRDFLIDLRTLLDHGECLGIVSIDLFLQRVLLAVDLVGAFLELFQLLLDVSRAGGKGRSEQAQRQSQRQERCTERTEEMLAGIHKNLLRP